MLANRKNSKLVIRAHTGKFLAEISDSCNIIFWTELMPKDAEILTNLFPVKDNVYWLYRYHCRQVNAHNIGRKRTSSSNWSTMWGVLLKTPSWLTAWPGTSNRIWISALRCLGVARRRIPNCWIYRIFFIDFLRSATETKPQWRPNYLNWGLRSNN